MRTGDFSISYIQNQRKIWSRNCKNLEWHMLEICDSRVHPFVSTLPARSAYHKKLAHIYFLKKDLAIC